MTATSLCASSVRRRLPLLVPLPTLHSLTLAAHLAVSNANDALEKVRLMALTNPSILAPAENLNVTVLADAESGRIVIRGAPSSLSPGFSLAA